MELFAKTVIMEAMNEVQESAPGVDRVRIRYIKKAF